jgi:hypothetical protein
MPLGFITQVGAGRPAVYCPPLPASLTADTVLPPQSLQGTLLPDFHVAYWIGLSLSPTTGSWYWLDNSPAPSRRTYLHWGTVMPGMIPEPDRGFSCAAANYTEAFEDPRAWGWGDNSCDQLLPYICEKAPEGAFTYASSSTLATYLLNTTATSFPDAQASCIASGGMLVAYASLEEQQEAEAVFEARGHFIPAFHGSYWMGLATSNWPDFGAWVDAKVPLTYTHWGTWADDAQLPEPNNLFGNENCAAANSTEAYGGAYGWSDTVCRRQLPFMCKIIREWRPAYDTVLQVLCARRPATCSMAQ